MSRILTLALISFITLGHTQSASAHEHASHAETQKQSPVLTLDMLYAYATAPNQKNGAAFGTLTNTTEHDLTIVAAHSSVSGRTEIHEMGMVDGVMKMRKLPSLEISAGDSTTLEPSGNHIMFMDLKAPLKAGDTIQVSLEFMDGSQQEITIPVQPAGQKPEDAHDHGHDMNHGHGE